MPVTKAMLAAYGCKTIEDYYDYIIYSKVNGSSHKCREQFKALSKDQRKACLIHMAGDLYTQADGYTPRQVHAAIGICIESIY